MGVALFSNNATSLISGATLASTSGAGAVFNVTPGEGMLFQAPTGGDFLILTLVDISGNYEIITVTARTTDTFTIGARAQEGTTAKNFPVGSRVELRITAAGITGKLDKAGGTITGGLSINGAIAASGTMTSNGILQANSTLNVIGASTFNGNIYGNIAALNGTLTVGGTTALNGPIAMSGTSMTIPNGLSVTGGTLSCTNIFLAGDQVLSNLAPSLQATPAQGQSDTHVATTQYVMRALGNYQNGVISTAVNSTLTAANCGQFIVCTAAAAFTITLPDANTCPAGSVLHISNASGSTVTISRGATNTITLNSANTTATSFTLLDGDTADIVTGGAGTTWWQICGGTVLSRYALGSFGSSLVAAGYQKLPGGLIIQWKQGTAYQAEGASSLTFPIAFPTACLFATVGTLGATAGPNTDAQFLMRSWTATTANYYLEGMGGSDIALTPLVFALGI